MRVRQWVLSVWESWFGGAEAAEEEAGEVEIEAVGVTEAEATPSPSEELKDRVLNAVKGAMVVHCSLLLVRGGSMCR